MLTWTNKAATILALLPRKKPGFFLASTPDLPTDPGLWDRIFEIPKSPGHGNNTSWQVAQPPL